MKLIVGLGNPEKKYWNTRHNIGFQVINALISHMGISLNKTKFNGKFYKNDKFIIAKPLTFVNLSGDFVKAICNFFKINTSDVLIIYDDADHDIGKISMKPQGSAGGQNGLKDIIYKLGTENIARIKIGIGRKKELTNHVLSDFSEEEKKLLQKLMPKIIEASKLFLKNDLNQAMKEANTK